MAKRQQLLRLRVSVRSVSSLLLLTFLCFDRIIFFAILFHSVYGEKFLRPMSQYRHAVKSMSYVRHARPAIHSDFI